MVSQIIRTTCQPRIYGFKNRYLPVLPQYRTDLPSNLCGRYLNPRTILDSDRRPCKISRPTLYSSRSWHCLSFSWYQISSKQQWILPYPGSLHRVHIKTPEYDAMQAAGYSISRRQSYFNIWYALGSCTLPKCRRSLTIPEHHSPRHRVCSESSLPLNALTSAL